MPEAVRLGYETAMNKKELVEAIVAELRGKVERHMTAARAAHAEATHEESKAEDKYDTRGLEASYLAAGQARQTAEAAAALTDFAALFLKKFPQGEPIDVSALVELETRKQRLHYFIGPSAGGLEVEHDGHTVIVLTPQAPLGQQLVGKKAGDTFKFKVGPFTDDYAIISVI